MKLVDRLVVMNFGSKLLEGLPSEVRADPSVQAAYLGGDVAMIAPPSGHQASVVEPSRKVANGVSA
jgi:branched-chain amino acid transport system permease protein